MLISTKFKFVFFCTPKCASNSIEAALKPYSNIRILGTPELRHTNYREYHRFLEPFLRDKVADSNIETVCLLREPLSWLYSWYRFRTRDELRDPSCPYHINSTAHIDFTEFVEAYISKQPPSFAQVGSQFDFVRDEADLFGIDRIFPYERIDDFIQHMSSKVGTPLSLRNLNVSPNTDSSASQPSSLMGKFARKVGRRLIHNAKNADAESVGAPSRHQVELAPELMAALRKHTQDFALYDLVKNHRYHKGGSLLCQPISMANSPD